MVIEVACYMSPHKSPYWTMCQSMLGNSDKKNYGVVVVGAALTHSITF